MINSAAYSTKGLCVALLNLLIFCEIPMSGDQIAPAVENYQRVLEEGKENSSEAFCLDSSFLPSKHCSLLGETTCMELGAGPPTYCTDPSNSLPGNRNQLLEWHQAWLCRLPVLSSSAAEEVTKLGGPI